MTLTVLSRLAPFSCLLVTVICDL